jgi:hypothetical protein
MASTAVDRNNLYGEAMSTDIGYEFYQIERELNLREAREADRLAADEWKAKRGRVQRVLSGPAYQEEKRRQENERLEKTVHRLQQQEMDYWREATKPTLVRRPDAVMKPSEYTCSSCRGTFPWDEDQADAAFKTCAPCWTAHFLRQLAQNPIESYDDDEEEWEDVYVSDSDSDSSMSDN